MIHKCDKPNCTRAGTCRAPKSRDLREYWHFCPEHAAEYNKNWNYYANMTAEEINADWERDVFGESKSSNITADQYAKFINDFITGRTAFDKMTPKKSATPNAVAVAFRTLDLPITATYREVGNAYRKLAKLHHPDTGKKDSGQFTKITAAYTTLKKYFRKS